MRDLPSIIEAVDDDVADVLRGKSGAERLEIASRMFASARRMLMNHLQSEHPEWNEMRVAQEAARRLSHGAV